MHRLRRTDPSTRTVQPDPVIRYFLWGVGAALILGALALLWHVVSQFNLVGTAVGIVLLAVLLGPAYVLLSLSFQSIAVFPDRLVVAQWLFRHPRTVYLARITALVQETVGPADVLSIHQMAEPTPLRLLDLYRREDVFFIVGVFEASRAPAPTDPDILRRAQRLREEHPGGGGGRDDRPR